MEGSAYLLPYPFIWCSVSVLILMRRFNFINSGETEFFLFFFCFAIFLLLSYGCVLFIKKRRECRSNIGITLLIIFAISFSGTEPLNWLMTFGEQKQYAVPVTDKWYLDSSYSKYYHLEVMQNGRYMDFQVSRQLYQSVAPYGQVCICYQKSIFGFPYYILCKPSENPAVSSSAPSDNPLHSPPCGIPVPYSASSATPPSTTRFSGFTLSP